MGKYELRTTKGYDFYEAASTIQKAIRRGDAKVAGFFALDMAERYGEYLWDRLLTISAEDCWGLLTQEIEALYNSWSRVTKKGKKGRIFISKAVIVLALAKKSRDADHLSNFIYDKDMVGVEEIEKYADGENIQIPEYAYDCHTRRGKKMGKTKKIFFEEEFDALRPRQKGLFDDVIQTNQKGR